jgi:hypothetical protein
MKRMVVVLFMVCLISFPFAQGASSQLEQPARQQRPPTLKEQAGKSKNLFYQLLAPETTIDPLNVEFRISVDNLPYLVERFTLSQAEASLNPALEILASAPAYLEKLYRLARKGKRQVKITVMLNGQARQDFSFGELRRYNRKLKNQPDFKPMAFRSKTLALRPFHQAGEDPLQLSDLTCEQQCNNDYSICAEMVCGSPTVFCDPCLEQLGQCMDACPPPPPPDNCPSESCTSTAQVIGYAYYGMQCFTNIFGQKRYFDKYLVQLKITKTCLVTDPCAGTQYTTTTYQYTSTWCDEETFFSCSFSSGSPITCFF